MDKSELQIIYKKLNEEYKLRKMTIFRLSEVYDKRIKQANVSYDPDEYLNANNYDEPKYGVVSYAFNTYDLLTIELLLRIIEKELGKPFTPFCKITKPIAEDIPKIKNIPNSINKDFLSKALKHIGGAQHQNFFAQRLYSTLDLTDKMTSSSPIVKKPKNQNIPTVNHDNSKNQQQGTVEITPQKTENSDNGALQKLFSSTRHNTVQKRYFDITKLGMDFEELKRHVFKLQDFFGPTFKLPLDLSIYNQDSITNINGDQFQIDTDMFKPPIQLLFRGLTRSSQGVLVKGYVPSSTHSVAVKTNVSLASFYFGNSPYGSIKVGDLLDKHVQFGETHFKSASVRFVIVKDYNDQVDVITQSLHSDPYKLHPLKKQSKHILGNEWLSREGKIYFHNKNKGSNLKGSAALEITLLDRNEGIIGTVTLTK